MLYLKPINAGLIKNIENNRGIIILIFIIYLSIIPMLMHVKNNNIIYGTNKRIKREFIDNEKNIIKSTIKK